MLKKIFKKIKYLFLKSLDGYLINSIHISLISKLDSCDKNLKRSLLKLVNKKKVAAGYVPYIHRRTELNIYNFFSINYGMRSPSHIVLSLTDKNFRPKHSIYKKLTSREILSINFAEIDSLFQNPHNYEFCIVMLMNEKMKINHGGEVGGNLRFWVNYDNFSSYVHSLPIANLTYIFFSKFFQKLSRKKVGTLHERRFYPQNSEKVYHYNYGDNFKVINERGDLSNKLIAPFGYSLIEQNNIFSAIFHNSSYVRESRFAKIKGEILHSIAIPPKIECDLELFFGEACSDKSEFIVSLYKKNRKTSKVYLSDQKNIVINNNKPLIFSDLFKIDDFYQYNHWLNFKALSGLHGSYYINVFYKSENIIFDNVHSHAFRPNNKSKHISRALKFAPFKLNEAFYPVLAIWSGKHNSVQVRLRIFSSQDPYYEKVFNFQLPRKEIVYFELENLIFKELENNKINDLFIAQIESEELDVNASMFNIKRKDNEICSISVDHLTGG